MYRKKTHFIISVVISRKNSKINFIYIIIELTPFYYSHVISEDEIQALRNSNQIQLNAPDQIIENSESLIQKFVPSMKKITSIYDDDNEIISNLPPDFDISGVSEKDIRKWSTQVMGELLG